MNDYSTKRLLEKHVLDAWTTRTVKPKFEERQQQVQSAPIVPMNDKQREYIELIHEKNVIVSTGYPWD